MRLKTFRDWIQSDIRTRDRELHHCLNHIEKLDIEIRAWVEVNPRDRGKKGPLLGIPFGVKDIVETKSMATEYGSPLYKGRQGKADAAIVTDLCHRGAVLLGKTVTTAFACRTPGPTRNPRNVAHTPGGSSSGSAAAVAAGMVPFSVGQQTRGSIIRPASYCGVTGFKPTFGTLPMRGVLTLAKSLDTLGFFTHTPDDMLALWKALGHSTGRGGKITFGVPEEIRFCEPEIAEAFRKALRLLSRSGLVIKEVPIANLLEKLDEANNTVMFYEGARANQNRFREFGESLDPAIKNIVRAGLQIAPERYRQTKLFIRKARKMFSQLFLTTPVILTPAATGLAPRGLASTGDPRMNSAWSTLGTPAISVPLPRAKRLPLGLQLTADRGEDGKLLQAASLVYRTLNAPVRKNIA